MATTTPAFILALALFSTPPQPAAAPQATPRYSIDAIRYASVPQFPLAQLVRGASREERIDIAMIVWLIRADGKNILFDSGFHHPKWIDQFSVTDFIPPDEAVGLAGVPADQVTDIIVSHAHWDHMGGLDRFPNAAVWIQKAEYDYYTSAAWQPGGRKGGIDPDDILELVRRNTSGQVRMIDGDDVEILPGIRVYTGARHTFASQDIRVAGEQPFVLASDNCYLYENLRARRASSTFDPADEPANLAAQQRMVTLAGSPDRVVPGHDLAQFQKYPAKGRIARIQP